jgi:hypothetical protein
MKYTNSKKLSEKVMPILGTGHCYLNKRRVNNYFKCIESQPQALALVLHIKDGQSIKSFSLVVYTIKHFTVVIFSSRHNA